MKLDDFEMAVIDLAHDGVRITVPNVVARLKVPPTKAEAWLDELGAKGRLEVEVDGDGIVYYRVRGLTTRARADRAGLVPYGERAVRQAAEGALRERFGQSSLPKDKRKNLLVAFLAALILPGLGLFYAAPWIAAIVATLGAIVLLWLAKIPLIGGIIAAATALTSGVAGLLYAVEYNKTGKRTHIFDKGPKRLTKGS
jgi:hypothetical protein